MSVKESNTHVIIQRTIDGSLTIAEAAGVLGVSERHIKRLKKGVKECGAEFLAHGNRGRKPANAVDAETRQLIVDMALGDYRDTSCEHMMELLAEHKSIRISAKSIGRILKQAQIKLRFAKKQPRRRKTRERKPREGMLVQCDASPYAWLDDRGPMMELHGAIDDATSKVLGLVFRPHEDLNGYLSMLKQVVQNYGIPQAIYSDRHTIFFSPLKDKLTVDDELAGKKVSLTQFGKSLQALGIAHIAARSPQAKGRVERLWGTLQARLVAELRIAGISTIEEANAFLPNFMARFNRKFSVKPKDEAGAFGAAPDAECLDLALSYREERSADGGSAISYYGVNYQLVDKCGTTALLKPRTKIQVLVSLDGSVSAIHSDERHTLRAVPKSEKVNKEHGPKDERKPRPQSAQHPWKQEQPKRVRHRRTSADKYFDEHPWLETALGDRDNT